MTATLNSTGVAYGDASQQNSAWLGIRGQVFTASGTFTVPTGVTAVRVTVVGGGGGGAHNTAGGSGGTSSFGAYVSATGGAGGAMTTSWTSGGTGSGGQFNLTGGYGGPAAGGAAGGANGYSFYGDSSGQLALAGQGPFGHGGSQNPTSGMVGTQPAVAQNPSGYGSGGGTFIFYAAGAGGGMSVGYVTGLTPGGSVAVTVGAGGSAGQGMTAAYGGGTAGIVIVEW